MSELASYKRGYDDCKEEMLSVIENIKAEIENKALDSTKYVACGLYDAIDIINKHIGERT